MGYDKKVYEEADSIIRERRNNALKVSELKKEKFFREYPQAEKLEKKLNYTMTKLIRVVLNGERELKSALNELKSENSAIQEEINQITDRLELILRSLNLNFSASCVRTGETRTAGFANATKSL